MIEHRKIFIGGRWVDPLSSETIEVVNPATEEVEARVPLANAADIERAVSAARSAFDVGPWPRLPASERGEILRAAGALLASRTAELVPMMTAQGGCTITFSEWAQVAPAVGQLAYYGGLGDEFEFEQTYSLGGTSLVSGEPVGVVAAIVPWNAPLFIAVNKLAPALLAGCSVVLKPAAETPLDSYVLAEVLAEAGLPEGVVSIVIADRQVSELLVRHRDVDKVSFTGSTSTGRRILAACGERIARATVELGGKSAAIVLDDADIEATVAGLMPRMYSNNGQVCTAQTRLLVSRQNDAAFTEALAAASAALVTGESDGPGDRHRSADQRDAARPRARVHRRSDRRRSPPAGGRIPIGSRTRMVRRAGGVRRRRQLDADRARGGVRPRHLCDPVHRHRSGGRDRERLRLRVVRIGVGQRRSAGGFGGEAPPHGKCQHQRRMGRRRRPVRRFQAVGTGARARGPRLAAVP